MDGGFLFVCAGCGDLSTGCALGVVVYSWLGIVASIDARDAALSVHLLQRSTSRQSECARALSRNTNTLTHYLPLRRNYANSDNS